MTPQPTDPTAKARELAKQAIATAEKIAVTLKETYAERHERIQKEQEEKEQKDV